MAKAKIERAKKCGRKLSKLLPKWCSFHSWFWQLNLLKLQGHWMIRTPRMLQRRWHFKLLWYDGWHNFYR